MLTRPQQILLKRAQAEAGLGDEDYRAAVATVSGMADCRSSKDRRLTDGHLDHLLGYFEAIHWRKVDAGELQASCKGAAVFRQRGFWAGRNQRGNTSRDRFVNQDVMRQITAREHELYALGYGLSYCQAIQQKLVGSGSFTPMAYLGALNRTLKSKQKAANQPF
jgi:hypothetical protein